MFPSIQVMLSQEEIMSVPVEFGIKFTVTFSVEKQPFPSVPVTV